MTIVMKFGGTSVGDAERIRRCAALVRTECDAGHRVVAVVSAMGGVTDQLLALTAAIHHGDEEQSARLLAGIRTVHEHAADALGARERLAPPLEELEQLVEGLSVTGEMTPRARDALLSFGERLSALLTAAALEGVALSGAEAGLVTDENHGEAEPLMELSLYQARTTLRPLLEAGQRVVVTGFIAATQHGVITTIGRGGSDYTATILGAALGADEIWIWSDVDGLMSADPRIVSDARLLEHIAFSEALEMGQLGAKSMHPRALEPAVEHGIPVRMRNTFRPDCAGTRIDADADRETTVRCVLRLRNVALLNVAGAAMVGRPGTAARVFQTLADAGVNIQVISQSVSESGISLVIPRGQVETARHALQSRLVRAGVARRVEVDASVNVIAAVGAGMAGVPGIAAKVFGAAAAAGVNIEAIAQGSSERSICFVTSERDAEAAVRAVHGAFGLGG